MDRHAALTTPPTRHGPRTNKATHDAHTVPNVRFIQRTIIRIVPEEPRPGENTYTRREKGGNNLRPDIKQLRTPLKRNIAELFDSTPVGEDDGGSEDAKTPIRTSRDSAFEKPSVFSLSPTQNAESDTDSANGAVQAEAQKDEGEKFGMWDGVFARCLLNIFGVIMFLRVPWMVAYAGLYNALLIIMISVSITGISATSLSAISTNGIVANGGAY